MKTKRDVKTDVTGLAKGKPIDDDFWEAFLAERDFLINNLFKNNSDLSYEDCEDIVGDFTTFYVEQASKEEAPGWRFEELSRANFVSRLKWKKQDFFRHRNAIRRGRGITHVSIDDDDFGDWGEMPAVEPLEVGPSVATEILLIALSEAVKDCEGKRLIVVQTLRRWLEGGCQTEFWTEELLPEEAEEFLALKKGVSLQGKASPAFCAVKKILREVLEREGLMERLSA